MNAAETIAAAIGTLIEVGELETDDREVIEECARRYIAAEHAKRRRASNRSVESFHKIKQERRDRLRSRVASIVTGMAKDVLPGWSAEMLAVQFAVGDGTEVSFADATVEQHEERAVWLEAHAASTLETASIHRRAIEDILASHADTLGGIIDALVA